MGSGWPSRRSEKHSELVLSKLAPGSYDLELDGELIGGVVRIRSAWRPPGLRNCWSLCRLASVRCPSRRWSTSSLPLWMHCNGGEPGGPQDARAVLGTRARCERHRAKYHPGKN